MKRFLYIALGFLLGAPALVFAVQISVPSGSSAGLLLQSLSNGNYNPVQLIAGSNITISSTTGAITINSTGGGGTFPFTVNSWGNSTTSVIAFTQGIITNASTTFSQLGTGAVFSQNGLILSHATTSASAAFQDVWRDANQNAFAQNFVSAGTSFPTNGATVTLTAASPRNWIFTGTLTQTMKLPSGTTLSVGATYTANNNSTGLVTVIDNGSNVLGYVLPGGKSEFVINDNSTSNGTWDAHALLGHNNTSGTGLTGFGTSSPFANLSIHANNLDTNTTLFAIGSSTQTATSTLFAVKNTGQVIIGSSTITNSLLAVDQSGSVGTMPVNTNTLLVKGMSGQTGSLITAQNNFGSVEFSVSPGGSVTALTGLSAGSFFSVTNAGMLVSASSTIGNGATAGGLTISGGATTTGTLTVQGNLTTNVTGVAGNCLHVDTNGVVSGTGSDCGGAGSSAIGGTGAVQFANSTSFDGDVNGLFFDKTNKKFGIGSSSPSYEFALHAMNGSSYSSNILLGVASSTSNSTTTLFSIDNIGNATSYKSLNTGTSTTMGFKFITDPTTNGNGLSCASSKAGSAVTCTVISDGGSESININSKGNGGVGLASGSIAANVNGNSFASFSNTFTASVSNTAVPFTINNTAQSAATAGANLPVEWFKTLSTRTHAVGALPISSDIEFDSALHAMNSFGSGNINQLTNVWIQGPPRTGTNATTSNAYAILVGSSTPSTQFNASTTNAYGLGIFAPAGAVNNYAATFMGGNVGVGTTSPFANFAIHANANDATIDKVLFAIGSSTASATTTLLTVDNQGNIKNTSNNVTGILPPFYTKTFSYASSTQGQGTTTRSIGVAPQALTLLSAQCDFSNFMRVLIYHGSGTRSDDLVASSTIGTVTLSTNTAFTAGEAIRVDIGTTTNIAANVYGSCTYKYVYN